MATDRTDVRNTGELDRNPDPITGAPGSHPTGAGIGAASGAATGAAIGMIGGPIGAAIGIIAGGIVGGLVGKGVGEKVDPTEDETYWRGEHKNRPYYSKDHDYDRDLAPAYRYGAVIGHGVGDDYDRPLSSSSPASTLDTSRSASDDTMGSTTSNVSSGTAGRPTSYDATKSSTGVASTTGYGSTSSGSGRSYDDYESDIRSGWDKVKGKSTLTYDRARDAIRDAFDRRVTNRSGTTNRPASTTSTAGR